jgi:glycosyltransferase involved in cell wall biosynthesis/radical SAM superfamily enzyme YgiQ (UPF0313 family)
MIPIKKNKIVLLSAFYEPFMSGAEQMVKEIAERLGDSYEIIVVTGRFDKSLPLQEKRDKFFLIRVGIGHKKLDKIFYPFLAAWQVRKIRPQIAHAIMESYAGGALVLVKYLYPSAKRILTLQSGDLDSDIKQKQFSLKFFWRIIHQSPDWVTAISGFLAQRAKKLGVPENKISIIPNGVDLSLVPPNTGIIPNRVVCVARLSWEKGLNYLVAAWPEVLRVVPAAKLVLVGEGDKRTEIEQMMRQFNLSDSIELLGNLSHPRVLEEIKKSQVFVCPSLAEGLGIVFIESQACGVPPIGTKVGGIPDVISNGKNGLLVEPKNSQLLAAAIIKLLSDQELRQRLAEKALIDVRRFNWIDVVGQVGALYEKFSARKKRLLIATGIYPPDIGGPATYVKGLEKGLADEFEIKIVAYGEKEQLESPSVYKISRRSNALFKYVKYFWQTAKLLPWADIVYLQGPMSEGLPAAMACKIFQKKYFLKIVGDFAWEQGSQRSGINDNLDQFQLKKYGWRVELWRYLQCLTAKGATTIVTPSNYLKKIITGWGVGTDKIKVIYNAVLKTTVHGSREQLRQELGWDGFVMVSVGRLVPWKGFAALIEIMPELSAAISDLKLVIIGDGPDRASLQELVSQKGLEKNIIFAGQLNKQEVAAYLKAADLFVLNTSYEGLSHVLIEAIGANLPIVTTAVGGNPELIEQYDRGLMVAYNDKPGLIQAIKQAQKTNWSALHPGDFLSQFDYDFMLSQISMLLKNEAAIVGVDYSKREQSKVLSDCDQQTVVLIQINFSQDHSETVLPLGILSVGSHLKRSGYKVKLVNITEKQINETAALIAEKKPLAVGLSVMTGIQTRHSAELSKRIKDLNKQIPIVWGGIHPSLLPEQCLSEDYIDFVVISEGELTMADLIEKIAKQESLTDVLGLGYKQEGKIMINPLRPFIANLDDFRLDFSLLDLNSYISPLKNFKRTIAYKASRGCPFNCTFCYNNAFNQNKWRVWSVNAVIEDILWLKENYQIDAIKFYDDNFFVDKNRAFEILKRIDLPTHLEVRIDTIDEDLAKKLKVFRVFDMLIGVESGSNRILSLIDKRFTVDRTIAGVKLLAKYDLPATYSAIVGLPTEIKEEFEQTVDLFYQIQQIHPQAVFSLGAYLPYPGSRMYDFAIKQGFKPPAKTEDWGDIDRFRKDFHSPWVDAQKVWRIREYFKLLNWRLGPLIPWFKWRLRHRFFVWPLDIYLVEYFGGLAIEQKGWGGKVLRKIYNLLRK